MMLLFLGTWIAAPALHASAGHANEAAWLPLFMAPTGLIGLIVCTINVWRRSTPLLVVAGVVWVIHVAIGVGLHPR
jgi:hypothetical protein